MSDNRYLIDSNVLSSLKPWERSSDFFRQRCLIPTEVLFESRDLNDIEYLKSFEFPTTASVLKILTEVLSTLAPNDVSLLDLYRNKGNADPLLVASAVDAQRKVHEGLFGETWIIVSNDKAVLAKAMEFEVPTLSGTQFSRLIQNGDEIDSVPEMWKDWKTQKRIDLDF